MRVFPSPYLGTGTGLTFPFTSAGISTGIDCRSLRESSEERFTRHLYHYDATKLYAYIFWATPQVDCEDTLDIVISYIRHTYQEVVPIA